MKKICVIIAVGFLLAGVFSLAFAEEAKTEMDTRGMMDGSMMGQGMMGQRMMAKDKMMGMCACPMMSKSLVAAQDGGVILLMGNKLQKYDKDLVLKKEVEIKIDMEAMRKMMEGCPMMGGKMDGDKSGDSQTMAH